jgi:4-amino-4-deoxy-L-arabinose transferase-like glycosyltransferase
MKHHDDPFPGLGPALACALIAQVANVLLAAVLAAQVPGGYRVRSWVFLTALLWSVAGTVFLLIRTAGGAKRDDASRIDARRIVLWLVSVWVWPILVRRRRLNPRGEIPP